MLLLLSADFSKVDFQKIFQEHNQNVKTIWVGTGILLAKVISRWQQESQ